MQTEAVYFVSFGVLRFLEDCFVLSQIHNPLLRVLEYLPSVS